MRIIRGLSLFTLLAVTLSACASLRVHSYTDAQSNVGRYRQYAWDETDPGAMGDPRLDNNRFFRERFVAAVDRELSRKGFERVAVQSGLIVRLHAFVGQQLDDRAVHAPPAACRNNDCPTFVFDEGTLLVDLIDARTRRLAWRGWAESDFEGVIDNQDWMEERIDRIVATMLQRLPQSGG